ncbi:MULTISPECIES: hypothetical protein [unclassified Aurantimonas]|uniref:hypothetical protein n=1 Tax=unclassified Aurantimonas TaxID=2638230 RepID=UPI002E16D66F|nr:MULTISPECIES: hypothetical protein [unclassified Aurantimonas]MEC5289376.1 hypothetical protein [Aurantimonas sp. C2-3-R2]MEC5410456.1 hypothetical protein [Aurantimonas sp. C2-4-R8]
MLCNRSRQNEVGNLIGNPNDIDVGGTELDGLSNGLKPDLFLAAGKPFDLEAELADQFFYDHHSLHEKGRPEGRPDA